MMQNFGRGFVFIALLIAACLAALQDYQNDIKKGIDLEGGTELLYEIPLSRSIRVKDRLWPQISRMSSHAVSTTTA